MTSANGQIYLSICLALAALNLVIGGIVSFLKLPVYLDSIGLVVGTVLLGWPWGLLCAVFTLAAGAFVVNPYLPFYGITALAIVLTTEWLRRRNMFSSIARTIGSGLIIAIVAAVISAPVTAYLFSGVTLSGVDALTAYFVATGSTLVNSVLLAGLASEPVDKILVALASYYALLGLPRDLIVRYGLRGIKH